MTNTMEWIKIEEGKEVPLGVDVLLISGEMWGGIGEFFTRFGHVLFCPYLQIFSRLPEPGYIYPLNELLDFNYCILEKPKENDD
jgi:hypothetical protein